MRHHERRRAWSRPSVLALLVGALLAGRMFLPTAIGLADNGDGPRLMCTLGVGPGPDGVTEHPFDHAVLEYSAPASASAKPLQACSPYPTTTRPLMQVAHALSSLLHLRADIDLRVLMVLYCVVAAGACVMLCRLAPGRGRPAVAAGVFLIAGDAAFVGYPGSPYTETAAIFGLLVLAPAAAFASRATRAAWVNPAAAATVGVAGAAVVGAKVPTITILAPVVLFLLWVGFGRPRQTRPRRRGQRLRLMALVAAVLVLVTGVKTFQDRPVEFGIINATDTLFAGVLAVSDNPEDDLRAMQLPPQLARYAGSSWWDEVPPQEDPAFTAARDRISYVTIGRFLLTHPVQALEVGDRAAKEFLAARPSYLGSYQAGDAPARARECRLCLVSALTSRFQGLGILLWGFVTLLLIAATTHTMRNRRPGSTAHALAAASLLLTGIGVIQFLTAGYGEAIETTKHMAIALLAGLLAVLLILMALSAGHVAPGHVAPGDGAPEDGAPEDGGSGQGAGKVPR